ncbi:endonuclease Q family protein [Candidatus Micrarchaeota archaeon]|nr:endonuclease Q family protein [Candidatus Micrarchaeota archaeon]
MRVIADLHVHSKYARATSPRCDIPGLSEGAKIKGINLIATGDFTHPAYFNEIRRDLAASDDGSGLYMHKGVWFILSTEIALIYRSGLGPKRMHHVVLAPSLETAAQINDLLGKRGNLRSDGRPILGLSSPEFAESLFSVSKDVMIIPAHAWTPWFSIFGSKSGVDTVEDAFEDQARNIFALETGLSSDPGMNWTLSSLDKYSLVSNSDAHSLEKLGREANVFELEKPTYKSLTDAIKTKKGFVKTYEFYPEEGKYHYDGHRECGIIMSPAEAKSRNNVCPVCRKTLTIGVLHRVSDLADRKAGFRPQGAVPFQYVVPLSIVISKALKKPEASKPVAEEYSKLIRYFGSEFAVFEAPEDQLRLATAKEIADAIIRVDTGRVRWVPGYDGVFGQLILDEASGEAKRGAVDRKQKSLGDF